MWLRTWLAGAKFTTHSWRCAAGRTADSKHLFGSDFFHGEDCAPSPRPWMVNFEQWNEESDALTVTGVGGPARNLGL